MKKVKTYQIFYPVIILSCLLFFSCAYTEDTDNTGIIGYWIFKLSSDFDSRKQTLEFSGGEESGSVLIEGQARGTFTVTEQTDGELTLIIKLNKDSLYSYKLWSTLLPADLEEGSISGYYHTIKDNITSNNFKWEAERQF